MLVTDLVWIILSFSGYFLFVFFLVGADSDKYYPKFL